MSVPSRLQNRLRSGRTALVVIDMQNDFCHADGALGRRGLDLAQTRAMAPRLAAFIGALRGTKAPILYTQTCHDSWTDSRAWRERQQGDTGGLCRSGSWGAEFYGVAPLPDERIVIKHRYNAFVGTDLDLVLRAASIETLLLTGAATNICVETTARDAFVRDYRIVMVQDCLAGSSVAEHDASLRTLERYFDAVVADAAAIIEVLGAAQPAGA